MLSYSCIPLPEEGQREEDITEAIDLCSGPCVPDESTSQSHQRKEHDESPPISLMYRENGGHFGLNVGSTDCHIFQPIVNIVHNHSPCPDQMGHKS